MILRTHDQPRKESGFTAEEKNSQRMLNKRKAASSCLLMLESCWGEFRLGRSCKTCSQSTAERKRETLFGIRSTNRDTPCCQFLDVCLALSDVKASSPILFWNNTQHTTKAAMPLLPSMPNDGRSSMLPLWWCAQQTISAHSHL